MIARSKTGRRFTVAVLLLLGLAAPVTPQESTAKRVRFERGRSSAVLKGAVVRGTRDRYVVGAKAGQTLTVSIASVERNAVFEIKQPNGPYLKDAAEGNDAMKWSGKLPVSGDYIVSVGGTRGNATYSLRIAIK